ncbi:MAG: ABC transporter ATP-binding protein [Candidatus Saccharibacteria bacterium]|nr:ABC transporter ATP-binding protein [Candidatus Saccharibacteria bacterium]
MLNKVISFHVREAMKHKKLAFTSLFFAPTTLLLERYVSPLFIAHVLNQIQTGTVTLESSVALIAGYFAIQIYSQVIGYRINLYAMWTVQTLGSNDLYKLSYDKLSQKSMAFYSDNFTGSLVSKVSRFSFAFSNFWGMVSFNLLFVATSIIATLVGIAFLVWQYAIALAILTVVFIVAVYFGTRFLRPFFKKRSEAYTELSGKVSDALTNIMAIKADANVDYERQRLNQSLDTVYGREMTVRNNFVKISSLYAGIISLMRAGALIASIWAIQSGLANAGVVYICLTYTFNLIEEIWNVVNIQRTYYEIVGDSEEMVELLKEEPSVKNLSNKHLVISKSTLEFDDVSFTHESSKEKDNVKELFSHFSLKIPAKQKLGLVGVSGSGKSTLIKLILRFIDVDDGKILIDGKNIADFTQDSLRENISYVPQEPILFHRSLRENISYSRPDAAIEEITEAAKKAYAMEFIDELPDGLETIVGERGVKLSGGQRQRIAIARAILKDAPILILDEATSALDSESEALIQKALKRLMEGRTTIVIAHRLSTIAQLDRIIVLEKGNVIEDGTHSQLLDNKETYARLWSHQSGGFLEE